ncbi:CRAL-TRIO domain-containing protein [Crucibulum laeve]|uniref:CRAL-TRIO domain-containing protein n=1 Tax=Crucibulum laeve TaxID=68775 RepID=A0A5C3LSV3_9AGAR|nr:CRAL-TRIO domain-containing protein [Crucibulum laeve]
MSTVAPPFPVTDSLSMKHDSADKEPVAKTVTVTKETVDQPSYKIPPGHVGNLTTPQQQTLDKLKKELQDEGNWVEERMDDAFLLRFLRARKFDFVQTKTMLLSAEQWRKDFGVEEIVKSFTYDEKPEIDKYYQLYYHKIDRDGRPVYVELLGNLNVKALYAATTPERLLQRLVYEYEKSSSLRLPACSSATGHPVENFCTIFDLGAHGSLSNFYRVKDYVFQAASIGQDRYPETMGKFYIINAPWAFSVVWSIVKPWLDEVTASKIEILGGGYKETLLKQIPAENLPKEFGGSCRCPGGCAMSDAGPWSVEGEKSVNGKS